MGLIGLFSVVLTKYFGKDRSQTLIGFSLNPVETARGPDKGQAGIHGRTAEGRRLLFRSVRRRIIVQSPLHRHCICINSVLFYYYFALFRLERDNFELSFLPISCTVISSLFLETNFVHACHAFKNIRK